MSQSASDIRKKLQKLEGFARMNISQLIEIANKVYNNRVEVAEREDRKRMEKKAALLAMALGRPPPNRKGEKKREGPEGHRRVDHDQCAYCRERGHWKRECPNWKKRPHKQEGDKVAPSILNLARLDSD